MIDLKPCPFCGAPDPIISRIDAPLVFVRCGVCHGRTANFVEYDHAVVAWNRRAEDPWIREAVRLMELAARETENGYTNEALAMTLREHIAKIKGAE